MGASIYAAGVLITPAGYATDTQKLKHHASAHDMLVVMANHNRPTGTWSPIGKSAIWSPDGCIGTQTCAADGSSWSTCTCGSAEDDDGCGCRAVGQSGSHGALVGLLGLGGLLGLAARRRRGARP